MLEKYKFQIRWIFFLLPVLMAAHINVFWTNHGIMRFLLFPFALAYLASFFVMPVFFIYYLCIKDWSQVMLLIVACLMNIPVLYSGVMG